MNKTQLYRILVLLALALTFIASVITASSVTKSRININVSSRAAIETLPGIGPVLADRIVSGRPYADVYELDRVEGVGPATIDGIIGRVDW
ncbi:helix-hairpin-helix domain-containing protein [Paenibacillus sp. FSL K6-4396]|uniref:ComEA family DNA-binding protein n=1 Tax=Paenibacillus sp. FSL K6-4396 TaxID=2921506 RepID=UPI0030F86AF3